MSFDSTDGKTDSSNGGTNTNVRNSAIGHNTSRMGYQFNNSPKISSAAGAEIVVITHTVNNQQMSEALAAIAALPEVAGLASHLGCL